jgi:cytidylate kinase
MKIALCGYLGAGCTEIAQILASKYGLETFNTSAFVNQIKPFMLLNSGKLDFDCVIMRQLEEILKRGNVIVEGRSTFMMLDRNDVIKVFLNTSLKNRIKHVAERRGITKEQAREDIKRSDEDRNRLIQKFIDKNKIDINDFDFMINTSSKTYSQIADIIATNIEQILPQSQDHASLRIESRHFPTEPITLEVNSLQ